MTKASEKSRPRYLVVRLETTREIPRKVFIRAIRKGANATGSGVYEDVKPWLTYFEMNHGVIRYSHDRKDGMLELVKNIVLKDLEGKPVEVTTLGISGTINKARKKYIP